MRWTLSVPLLLLTCLQPTRTVAIDSAPLDIWCLDDYTRAEEDLMEYVGDNLQNCNMEEIMMYPFSSDDALTPPKSESIATEIRIYNASDDSTQIAVFISWIYKRDHFDSVEAYHIETNYRTGAYGRYYHLLFNWNQDLREAIHNSTAKLLNFHSIYTIDLEPNDVFWVRLQALPSYLYDGEPQIVEKLVEVSGCHNYPIRAVDQCRAARDCKGNNIWINGLCLPRLQDNKVETTTAATSLPVPLPPATDEFTLLAALIVGLVLLLWLLAVLIWCLQRRTCIASMKTEQGQKNTRILLICTSDATYLESINQLIRLLLTIPGVEVVCNLRQRTEIGTQGIQEWTKTESVKSDIVCFVVANRFEITKSDSSEESRLDDVEKHQMLIVVGAIETMIVNKAFGRSTKQIMVLDLNRCVDRVSLPYFTRCKLPGEMRKFLKPFKGNISKSQSKIVDGEKKLLVKLLANTKPIFDNDNEKSNVDKISISISNDIESNDLNDLEADSTSYNKIDIPNGNNFSMNILSSVQSSYDCDGSGFVTTDYNHENFVEEERFLPSGARPKQPRV